jgi:hypothetical protein
MEKNDFFYLIYINKKYNIMKRNELTEELKKYGFKLKNLNKLYKKELLQIYMLMQKIDNNFKNLNYK